MKKTIKKLAKKFKEEREAVYLGCSDDPNDTGEVSLRRAARDTKIPHATLCRIEQGKSISFENFINLCDYYDLSYNAVIENCTVRNKKGQLI